MEIINVTYAGGIVLLLVGIVLFIKYLQTAVFIYRKLPKEAERYLSFDWVKYAYALLKEYSKEEYTGKHIKNVKYECLNKIEDEHGHIHDKKIYYTLKLMINVFVDMHIGDDKSPISLNFSDKNNFIGLNL